MISLRKVIDNNEYPMDFPILLRYQIETWAQQKSEKSE